MFKYRRQSLRVAVAGPFAGLLGLLAVTGAPAAAQSTSTACTTTGSTEITQASDVVVEFLGTGTSNTILMHQLDGFFQGEVRVRVYCGADGRLIPDAHIEMWTSVPGNQILDSDSGIWTESSQSNPVTLELPTGERLISIRSSEPEMEGWRAKVGTSTVSVTGAYGFALTGNDVPTATGGIWSQTPELGSFALFGSGAAGMASYAFVWLRTHRRPPTQ